MNVRPKMAIGVLAALALQPYVAAPQDLARPNLEPFVPPPCVAGQEMFTAGRRSLDRRLPATPEMSRRFASIPSHRG